MPAEVRLSPLVRRLVAPNASPMTGGGTNTYLVGIGRVTVIDPGPADAGHIERILEAVGDATVARVLITHGHPDHAPGARPLSSRTGAAVLTHPFALRDGTILSGGGATLEVLHTPGHTPDHVALVLREERALFSGDLIVAGSTVVVAPPDGDMAAYMASLGRLARERLSRIYPGHGEVIERPAEAIDQYLRHRRMREEQILAALESGPARIPELVARIYADVPAPLHGLAARSVHAHLLKLRAEGRVAGTDAASPWRRV